MPQWDYFAGETHGSCKESHGEMIELLGGEGKRNTFSNSEGRDASHFILKEMEKKQSGTVLHLRMVTNKNKEL